MKKHIAAGLVISMMLTFPIAGCGRNDQTPQTAQNQTGEQLQQELQQQLSEEKGAFEIYAEQKAMAAENEAGYTVLDAGKGNCNWINTQARYAHARFTQFALQEAERNFQYDHMAGQAQLEGIGDRFTAAMNPEDDTDRFLLDAVDYCVKTLHMDRDAIVKELADACTGNYYPQPNRVLTHTEQIQMAYLQDTLFAGKDLSAETDVFPTNGASGAINYIFETLSHNRVLKPGDKIAIAEPIFTPYLQIPNVMNYGLVTVDVEYDEAYHWDLTDEKLKMLEDSEVKAFFLANPANPSGQSLSKETMEKLGKVLEKNPDLIIITDEVYGAFMEDFQSIYATYPQNTILVYSFSKVYGATGWRVGLMAVNKDNVVDRLIQQLPQEDKEYLHKEYINIDADPDHMKFIDRAVADSGAIGLYMCAGLSTPQQAFMDFLALSHLVWVGKEADPYVEEANALIDTRYAALMDGLNLPTEEPENNTGFYVMLDIYKLADNYLGTEFGDWMRENVTDLDFLNDLAKKKGVVLMYGKGFGGKEGTARVCLSNLDPDELNQIGPRMYEYFDELNAQR